MIIHPTEEEVLARFKIRHRLIGCVVNEEFRVVVNTPLNHIASLTANSGLRISSIEGAGAIRRHGLQ